MIEQIDALAEQVEKLIERRRGAVIGEDVLFGRLTETLVQKAKLEVIDYDVFVVGGNQRRRLGPRNRQKFLRIELLAQQLHSKKKKKNKKMLSQIVKNGKRNALYFKNKIYT